MSIFKFGSCLAVAVLIYYIPNLNPQRILPCNIQIYEIIRVVLDYIIKVSSETFFSVARLLRSQNLHLLNDLTDKQLYNAHCSWVGRCYRLCNFM